MAIPAYLWLKDDGGADIRGSVDVAGREGSIEILGLNHCITLPTDNATGCIIMSRSTRRRVLREGGTLEVVQ